VNADLSNPVDLVALIVTLAFMLGMCWVAVKVGKAVLGVGGPAVKGTVEAAKAAKTTAKSMGATGWGLLVGVLGLVVGSIVAEADSTTGTIMVVGGFLLFILSARK